MAGFFLFSLEQNKIDSKAKARHLYFELFKKDFVLCFLPFLFLFFGVVGPSHHPTHIPTLLLGHQMLSFLVFVNEGTPGANRRRISANLVPFPSTLWEIFIRSFFKSLVKFA